MFKKVNASSSTQSASDAGSSASGKKKKKNVNVRKILHGVGYVAAGLFIIVAVRQSTSAFSSINTASIVYSNELAKMQAEQKKAQQAVADKLDVNITDNGDIVSKDDTSDSNPVDITNTSDKSNKSNAKSSDKYYMDDDGNIIHVDAKGEKTLYYICTTCSKCGEITKNDTVCSKCGSDLCKYTVYQVQDGDTLSQVSGKVGASVDSIAHLNELDNVNLIYTGESLRIPQ